MLEMSGGFLRLEGDVVKNIIHFLELEENPKYGDICNKCIGYCKCEYRDKYAKEALIESFIPMVKGYVLTAYQGRQEWYIREILAEGLLILTETVNQLHSNIESPEKFIKSHIALSLRRFVLYDRVVKSRQKDLKRASVRDDQTVTQTVVPQIDFDDSVNTIITDAREKAILQALQEGYTTIEVGDKVGCSPSTVSRIRYKIFESLAEELK